MSPEEIIQQSVFMNLLTLSQRCDRREPQIAIFINFIPVGETCFESVSHLQEIIL